MAAEQKTGIINGFYDADTGSIIEDGSGEIRDFYHPGAQASFVQSDSVTYLLVILPNGRPPIVKDVKKP